MTKEISAMRERITSIKHELGALRSGNSIVDKGTALARIDEYIDGQIVEGRRFVESFVAQNRVLNMDAGQLFQPHRADAIRIALNPDPIRKALHAEVSRQCSDGDGIEPGQVEARINALANELLTLEQREYAACTKAGIDPRHDTDPAILLGIA